MSQETFFPQNQCVEDAINNHVEDARAIKPGKQHFSRELLKTYVISLKKKN